MLSMCLQGGPAQWTVPTNQTQACDVINKALFDSGLLGCLPVGPAPRLHPRTSSVHLGSQSSPRSVPLGLRGPGCSGHSGASEREDGDARP